MSTEHKAVLLSIRPEWCVKILNREKTVEIRKNRPKLKPPFRCYIYCTKSAGRFAIPNADGKPVESAGKVIGEFTCDKIRFYSGKSWLVKEDIESVTAGSCLSLEQVKEYAGWRKAASFMDRKDLYAWHISDLKVYDAPVELSMIAALRKTKFGYEPVEIKKPPQSWCYVAEAKEDDAL